mgnify:FL=1|tara:strand:- start:677 stop:1318 length:642 start_codon:yes stop_codon:yes gene_type:complete
MVDLNSYDIFIFDCDGVILDSNSLKTDAFRDALKSEPKHLIEEMITYHMVNGGISRYKKFNHFFSKIRSSDDIEKDTDQAIKKFADFVRSGLLEVEFIPGVISFLESTFCSKHIYVNSGSDENELRHVFQKRNISHFFKEIYGSPNTKEVNMRKILEKYGQDSKAIFFGDSASDYEAARSSKTDFVFVSDVSEWKNPEGDFTFVIENFESIIV